MTAEEETPAEPKLDAGTYEVLRARLGEQAEALAGRAEALNVRRVETFGGAELRLVGAERIRTENNCVPRDIAAVGELLLFGYNVFIGLRPETTVDDVFAVHRFVRDGEEFRFAPAESDLLRDPQFERDFTELYRYYRDSRLLQLRHVEGRLLAVFQTGLEAEHDTRVLRWKTGTDGTVVYQDNLGEPDHVFPPSHDFTWIETTRDDHVLGRHPHISIEDEVFVETVGGDLTVKLENNTETGEGIYREPVAEALQSLADAEVEYARVGALILLRVRPYKEEERRHLVFNTRTRSVVRLDGIGQACRRLPEDQGIIFPGGYYLVTGTVKTFDTDTDRLEYERVIRSPNGEDALYVFHAREAGRYLLLPYNLIRKEVATPITCHGYSLFGDGTLVSFRADSAEPTRVHQMQVWQTPYVSDTYAAAQPVGTGPLERVGNADLVRGISDALSIARTVAETAPSEAVLEALIAACDRAADRYFWFGEHGLREPLDGVRATAEQVLEEYENVQRLTAQASGALAEADERVTALIRQTRGESPATAETWVSRLAELRRAQGRLETLREMRYADTAGIDALAGTLGDELTAAGGRAVAFLQGPDAFTGYHERIGRIGADAESIATAAEADPVRERLAEQTHGLETLTEVVGSLDVADARVRTSILARIGEALAEINQAQASLTARRRELLDAEGRAAFAAEFALLGQAVTAALAMADSPAHCDDQLGRMMLQLETLESRFAEFDDFVAQLSARREEVYEAFSARKQALVDERVRRADRLAESATRILTGIQRRVAELDSLDDINTYFAADPMVAKVRGVADRLRDIGDSVRAEELDGRLKAARQDAGRVLRDRVDLYEGGGQAIRLGRHRFAVNTQPLDLTLVPYEGGMAYAVTATDYRLPVRDPDFAATRPYWDQPLVSETPEVYRSEYLAADLLTGPSLPALRSAAGSGDALLAEVRRVAETRYDEGYERGVHDRDAALILEVLLRLHDGAGLLRYPPSARAAAQLFWAHGATKEDRASWA
ncbi:DNA repair ATPase, partial [Actinoallomurus acaciae]